MNQHSRPNDIRLPERFSARIQRSDGRYSRIYRDGLKFRRESYDSEKELRQLVISREDLEIAYRIEESEKTYFTIPLTLELIRAQKGQQFIAPEAEWTKVKEEEVDGELCDVFVIIWPPGKEGDTDHFLPREIVHISQHSRWFRRIATFDKFGRPGIIIDWLEVSFEPIPPGLFNVPSGFVEVSLASGRPLEKRKPEQ